MKIITQRNLQDAFAGESQAHMKYMVFADQAEREGLANIARLFRAASYSEQMHATAHLRALSGVNATAKNLEVALGGENFEIDEMYPSYSAVANLQGEKAAVSSMDRAFQAEKIHSKLYARAKETAEASFGNDSSRKGSKLRDDLGLWCSRDAMRRKYLELLITRSVIVANEENL